MNHKNAIKLESKVKRFLKLIEESLKYFKIKRPDTIPLSLG